MNFTAPNNQVIVKCLLSTLYLVSLFKYAGIILIMILVRFRVWEIDSTKYKYK